MKKIASNLTKEQIAMAKGYRQWCRVVEGELRLFVNEKQKSDTGILHNKIDWKNNIAYLCINDFEYSKGFYEKNKDYQVRIFVKADAGNLYSEYAVKSWDLGENSLEVILV
ncbi:hypothetical protein [Clostridium sp. YIM B02569]|uniref:hypothetical protein n=1 Tax=Clostridium sp. YIM B02569 TaxID=2911967 RepID=UPI001EEBC88A|nr:hypothetical protein [Clostridium sp. YIM B02569]